MPGIIDLVIAGLIAIAYPIWDYFSAWPRMLQTISSGRPHARVLVYREILAVEWLLTAVIAGAWIQAARPWSQMGLMLPAGWRLVATLTLLAALVMLLRSQLRIIRRLEPAKLARIRARQAAAATLVPRSRLERAWFVAVALSAGLCEELIYRGFLLWAFRPWLGLWGAALAGTIGFGLAHAYQGHRGAIRAGVIGAVFALMAIAMGSIVPGMALHALLDLISGETGYAIFAEDSNRTAA